MPRRLAAVLLFLIGFTATARASTLEVTSGSIRMIQPLFDTCGGISGDRFPLMTPCFNGPFFFPPLDGTTNAHFYIQRVMIDGVLYNGPPRGGPPFFDEPQNLQMLFVHDPIPFVTTPVVIPFAMTGTLSLLDPVTGQPVIFDLIGQGMVNCCYRYDPVVDFNFVTVEMVFTPVPEPSSLRLLVSAIAPSLVVLRLSRRRTI